MPSKNYAIYNQRSVFVFDSVPFGRFIYIAIGALCVGSVRSALAVGGNIAKGDVLGQFEFGGSTIATVWPGQSIAFDTDIVQASRLKVESYVNVGQQIAQQAAAS